MRVHSRAILGVSAVRVRNGIAVTSVTLVLVDLAARLSQSHLEAAVNMADSSDLLDTDDLRMALERYRGVPGVARLRRLLDRESFRLTDSELERMFLRVVSRLGLPAPQTRRYLSGHRVDFTWPDAGLVVETDSLRYHRTPIQQRRDAARDHAHLLAGRESRRFTHYQLAYEQDHVRATLLAAWRRAHALDPSILRAPTR